MPRGQSRFVDFLQPDGRLARNQSNEKRKRYAELRFKAMMEARERDTTPWPKVETDIAAALRGRLYGPKKTGDEKAALQFRRTG